MVQDPRYRLQSFIQQGRELHELTRSLPNQTAQRNTVDFGTRLLANVLDAPELRSGIARTIGQAMVGSNVAQRSVELTGRFSQWENSVRHFLGTVSVAGPSLAVHGNSARLIGRFVRALQAASLRARLGKALRFLETLDGQQLVLNGEILEYLKEQAIRKAQNKRVKAELRLMDIPEIAPGFDAIKFTRRDALRSRFAEFQSEARMIEGAMDTYLGEGPDKNRQALASARNALESVARSITKTDQWRDAIKAVAGESTKNIFRDTYQFLAGRGSHPGKPPSNGDTELGIHQAISCVNWLLAHREFFSGRP